MVLDNQLAPLAHRFRAASRLVRNSFSLAVASSLSNTQPADSAQAVETQILTAITSASDLLPRTRSYAQIGTVLCNKTPDETTRDAFTYFDSLYTADAKQPDPLPPEPLSAESARRLDLSVLHAPVTAAEILRALKTRKKKMGADFAHGLNTIVLSFLAYHATTLRFLTRYVQLSLNDGFTDAASSVGTILIPKVPRPPPSEVRATRPIALNPAIAKLPKTVLSHRLQRAVVPAVADCQHGFRKGHTPQQCTQKLLDRLRQPQVNGIFLDVAKAYDTLAHSAVSDALHRFRVPTPLCNVIMSYLTAARTRIHAGPSVSAWVLLRRGLLRGCPLSPILFSRQTGYSQRALPPSTSALLMTWQPLASMGRSSAHSRAGRRR